MRGDSSITGVAAPRAAATAALDELDVTSLGTVDAVVLLVDRAEDAGRVLPQLATLEDESIAVMTLLGEALEPSPYHGFAGAS